MYEYHDFGSFRSEEKSVKFVKADQVEIKKCEICLQRYDVYFGKGDLKTRKRICYPCYKSIKCDLDKMKRSGNIVSFKEHLENKILIENLSRC